MTPTITLDVCAQFFWDHAGYSYNPQTESEAAGRTRCAHLLAEAESLYLEAHRVADVNMQWFDDPYGAGDANKSGLEFDVCESAAIYGPTGVLASLHSILDASDEYKRVIRAELASECADQLRAIIKGE